LFWWKASRHGNMSWLPWWPALLNMPDPAKEEAAGIFHNGWSLQICLSQIWTNLLFSLSSTHYRKPATVFYKGRDPLALRRWRNWFCIPSGITSWSRKTKTVTRKISP
jgi:hypothetical protein